MPSAPKRYLPLNIKGWSPDWLMGTTLRLISETQVFDLNFCENGWVAVTTGLKGGPLSGPLHPWRIEDRKLFIGFPDQTGAFLEFVSITDHKLRVRSQGEEVIYEISR